VQTTWHRHNEEQQTQFELLRMYYGSGTVDRSVSGQLANAAA